MRFVLALLLTAGIVGTPHPGRARAADAGSFQVTPLRADPDRVCQASAVVRSAAGSVLVIDSEVDDTAFGFEPNADGLTAAKAANLDLGAIPDAERPRDVEAAARVVRYLVLVGSHSRNEDCEVRADRERILVAELDESGTAARTSRALDDARVLEQLRGGDERKCLEVLFTVVGRASEASIALCRALVAAERTASKDACGTFAIAGAATTVENSRERLWLGLRAPLVDGKAAFVRMASIEALRFDATTLVDLAGMGIRELTMRNRKLLVIAAPPGDAPTPFALWEVTPPLDTPVPLVPRLLRNDLPTSSEGLLATDDGVVVTIDGAAGKKGEPCKAPARQYRVTLPGGDR